MKQKILCMGSINMDLVMYLDKMPQPGETIVTDNFQTFPGGKGGNQAAAAAILGGSVTFFTKLGDDEFSLVLTQRQKEYGVEMSHVIYKEGATAGIAMIRVDKEGQNSISFTPGANSFLTPEDVIENKYLFQECQILLITMEINTDTVYEAIRTAKAYGMTVILDPAPAPEHGIPKEIAVLVDYIKPNETEAQTLTGIEVKDEESASRALEALKKQGFCNPILTMAGNGALTYLDGQISIIPPVNVRSLDSTAAGDIFLGSFTAALAQGKSYRKCLNYASVAAAVSTTRRGAQSSIPLHEEIILHLE